MEYLIKVSAVTALFYVCYKLFLQKETFFQSNRWYLLIGLISSFFIPLVVIPIYVTKTIEPMTYDLGTQLTTITYEGAISTAESFDWTQVAWLIYGLGIVFLLSRFLIQLFSLIDLIAKNKKHKSGNYQLVQVNDPIAPFSFFNYIVYNSKNYSKEELHQIITHEKVHANQWHSIDILVTHVITAVFWFNPLVWFYKKDLQQNLEFIADQITQEQLEDSKSYQYTLLKNSVPNYQMALANNFFNSLIKKRIVMLHKNKSNQSNQLKMGLILPLVAIFLMSFNTVEIETLEAPILLPENNTEAYFGEVEDIIITKSMTDDQLDAITASMEKRGITLKFKGIKRNGSGEITNIKITAKTEKSNANISESNDDGINPIKITVDGNSISIGDLEHSHKGKDYFFESKDGNHTIHKSKSGSNVFVYSDAHEHDDDHEVIEDKDKIIIKNGDKVHEIKKVHKDKNVWVSDEDGEIIEIKGKGDNDVMIIRKDKDGNISKSKWEGKGGNVFFSDDAKVIEIKEDDDDNIFIIRKDKDGNYSKSIFDSEGDNVWISSDDDENTFKVKTIGKGEDKIKVFFSDSNDDESPLYILDGKEISEDKAKDLDTDKIETINVLKGDAATKKYGEKAKNGVVEMTSKKDD